MQALQNMGKPQDKQGGGEKGNNARLRRGKENSTEPPKGRGEGGKKIDGKGQLPGRQGIAASEKRGRKTEKRAKHLSTPREKGGSSKRTSKQKGKGGEKGGKRREIKLMIKADRFRSTEE